MSTSQQICAQFMHLLGYIGLELVDFTQIFTITSLALEIARVPVKQPSRTGANASWIYKELVI